VGELPLNLDVVAVGATIPCFGLAAEGGDIADPAFSETLAAEKADLDLRLVQPTAVFRNAP
jgi:hypothetical protein